VNALLDRAKNCQLLLALIAITCLSAVAAWFTYTHGYTLYYGDAEAHLNIARRLLDNRKLSGEELGTVWLPLPHVLMAPFAAINFLWKNGLAGVFVSLACFTTAAAFLFASARRVFDSNAAGWTAALVFALNPNMLYLQSAPMTEPFFAAALGALLWATVRYRDHPGWTFLLAAVAASNAASLTRYEGWFLIPFAALFVTGAGKSIAHVLCFASLASLSPLAWLVHNQFYYSNALEFYNGPYSAIAIAREGLAHGVERYPGAGNWPEAIQYFVGAMRLTVGNPLSVIAALGLPLMFLRGRRWPLLLLALPPIFYVISMHSASTPIYVPSLWPFTWYNIRYGLAALPLCAFAAAALVSAVRGSAFRAPLVCSLICALVTVPWFFGVIPCWKESEVNSVARRNWTAQAAEFLAKEYEPGSSFIYTFGDLSGILRNAGIALRGGTHQDNYVAWYSAVQRPDLFLTQEWVIAQAGDKLSQAAASLHDRYELAKRISVNGATDVEIYRRRPIGREVAALGVQPRRQDNATSPR